MKNFVLSLCLMLSVAPAGATDILSLKLEKEWTTPLGVGDKVPDVTFSTRTRIDADVENPFDWKSKEYTCIACL